MMKKKRYYNHFKLCILFLFLLLGLFLRINSKYDTLTLNTVAFYFSRAVYLESTGDYLKEDDKTLAQYNYKENYPPLPAYIAVPVYKITKPFIVNFEKFLAYFPVLIYIVTFFTGFALIKSLYNFDAGLFFSMLLSITPVAVKSTMKTYYTEEALGILFIILSIYYLAKAKKFDSNFYFALLFLTLLSLTWQVFLLIDLVIGILFLFSIQNKKLIVIYSVLVLFPLIIGHMVSVYLIGLDYSPIYMIKESMITIRDSNKPYFRIAFDRLDLKTSGINHIFNEFGYFVSLLILAGFMYLVFNFKEQKNKVLMVSGIIASITFLQSVKFRYSAMASLIIIGALGAYSLLNFGSLRKVNKIAVGVISLLIILFFILNKIGSPSCDVKLETPKSVQLDRYYELTFTIKNVGFNPACDKFIDNNHAFGGIHIEIENATILNTSIVPSYSEMSFKYQVPINDIRWFEAKFDCLRSGENRTIKLWIMPRSKNVKVNYRCWLPKKSCQKEAPIGMRPSYQAAWRNEACLERYPMSGNLCGIRVFAGYFERKDFYCISKVLS